MKSYEHVTAICASVLDDLDKFIYRESKRIERMKEADSVSVELFAIDVTSNGDE